MEAKHTARGRRGLYTMLNTEPFNIQLAGITIAVQTQFPQTEIFCKNYLSKNTADFSIIITPEDIIREREKSAMIDLKEGRKIHRHFDEYLETLALYRKIADKLTDYRTILVHGSAVAVDGQGYLFTAPSGTGKSTHVRLWRELLGERAIIINDDKPLISQNESGVYIHGTPWCGKHNLNTNISVPLKAICLLTRGEKDYIEPIESATAMPMLLQQTHRPQNGEKIRSVLSSVEHLSKTVRFYRLECTMNPTAAKISFNTMSHGK